MVKNQKATPVDQTNNRRAARIGRRRISEADSGMHLHARQRETDEGMLADGEREASPGPTPTELPTKPPATNPTKGINAVGVPGAEEAVDEAEEEVEEVGTTRGEEEEGERTSLGKSPR